MLSKQRHAELEEEFYEVWHPEQGTNMQDMLVHKVMGLESEIKLRNGGPATTLLLHQLIEKGWKPPDEVAKLERVARAAKKVTDISFDVIYQVPGRRLDLHEALKEAEGLF